MVGTEYMNEIGRQYSFSRFRDYQAPGPAPIPPATRSFPFSRDAPAAARHFAVGQLARLASTQLADDTALVVTELAANAVVHAHSGFTVALSAHGDTLRISVRDQTPLPSPTDSGSALAPAPLHGLGAVDAMATRWGVTSLGSAGKTVWVDLRRLLHNARRGIAHPDRPAPIRAARGRILRAVPEAARIHIGSLVQEPGGQCVSLSFASGGVVAFAVSAVYPGKRPLRRAACPELQVRQGGARGEYR